MFHRNPKLTIAAAVLVASSAFAQAQRPTKVDDVALRNAATSKGEEWLSYGFTPQETRYSPLTQIDKTNVSRLGLVWSYDVGPGGGGQEATPLVHNGVIFSITQWSVVFAIDVKTGKQKWKWDPEINQNAIRGKICCGVVQRGIAMYDGKIIAPAIDGRLIALDEETGKPVWESRVSWPQDNYTITMAPRIAKGKVIVGVSGGEYPSRGFISAFDAKSGAHAWKFYTIPGEGDKDPGLIKARATWPKEIIGGGGGGVWDAISYDPDLELVYIGTGNPGPWSEDVRKSKGMDLLYADAIVAVDVNTGLYKWHFQNVPGDDWDYDSVQHLLQADVTIKGQKRKVLMQANKNGFLYTIDRTNGKFIQATPIAKINWALGVDEVSGKPIINPEARYTANDSVRITPGPGGAHNWSPMSFNPNTGLLYTSAQTGGGFDYTAIANFEYNPQGQNMGIVFGGPRPAGPKPAATKPDPNENVSPEVAAARAAAALAAQTGQTASAPPAPAPVKRPPLKTIGPDVADGGYLVAYDPATGKERWRVPGGTAIGGGTFTTASNLVFQAHTGTIYAYTADKGEKLLELKVGVPGGMAPPITFMVDGKQYVAIQVGQGGQQGPPPGAGGGGAGGGAGAGPAPLPNPAAPKPVLPKLLVFAVDGTAKLP